MNKSAEGPSDVEIARENEIKIGITQELSKALKNVQKENVDCNDQQVYSTETANSVCHCLEAVFLHGFKSSSVKKIANMVGLGQQAISQPSLNFWNFAAKFTHSEVVSQLKHLGQVTSEIGLCRAWIRVALNDCLIESYVDAMVADKKTLQYYYHSTAYLRDSEQPEIMKSLIHGLMTFEFKLSYNSSVLNEWSYAPLRLAGIIDVNDAPLPVIKPAAFNSARSNSSSQASDSGIQAIRSGSKQRKERSRKSKEERNPMEQPAFGAPSDSSYYVSSSEFTSKDVEEFKKLASMSSPMAHSECSSSSHISCPDPPHLNLSPAAYVGKKYTDMAGSPLSLKTGASEDSFQGNDSVGDRLNSDITLQPDDLVNENGVYIREKDKEKAKLQVEMDFPDVSKPCKELLDEIYSEMKQTEDLLDGQVADINDDYERKNEMEESWEEFYKSPVKKNADNQPFEKPFQRLESFQQEITEKQIVESYVHSDDEEEKAIGYEVPDSIQTVNQSRIHTETDNSNSSRDNFSTVLDTKQMAKKENVFTEKEIDEVLNRIQQEVQESMERSRDTSSISIEADTSLVLDSKSIERGSDIEKMSEVSAKTIEKTVIAPGNGDTLQTKTQAFLEEKIMVDDDEDDLIEHKRSSPAKRRKSKVKSSASKLKPNLSLSPPKTGPLVPELSDAVADKVDRIQTLENPEYLSRHRFSLPVASMGSKSKGKGQRKSMPDVLENKRDGAIDTLGEIQEHLHDIYDGKPIDDEDGDKENQIDEEEAEALRQRMIGSDHRQSIGNNLMLTGRGWSSSFDSEMEDTVDAFSPPRSQGTFPVLRPKSESFGTMLQNYTPASSASARSIDDVLQHFPRKDTVASPSSAGPSSSPEELENFEEFEVVCQSDTPDPASVEKLTQVVEIANEKGLDAQNFQCKGCNRALGLIFGRPRVCKFDGGYYCYECHENEEYYIPAVILHNWDFRKHQVCKKNLEFLQEIEEQPYINVEKANPRLFDHVPEMKEIRTLREQLNFLKTYLFTCKQSIAEDLRRLVWPRDYLYENTELYSLADLLQVPTGGLAKSISKVIKFAISHVHKCPLCNQKGFICELCNNPKVIYPFEVDTTYRCPQCKTVLHKDCKTDNRPCPKCHRRLLRENTHGISDSQNDSLYDYVMP